MARATGLEIAKKEYEIIRKEFSQIKRKYPNLEELSKGFLSQEDRLDLRGYMTLLSSIMVPLERECKQTKDYKSYHRAEDLFSDLLRYLQADRIPPGSFYILDQRKESPTYHKWIK